MSAGQEEGVLEEVGGPRRSGLISDFSSLISHRSASHPCDQVGHGEAKADEADEGGEQGTGGDDGERGQVGEGHAGERFAGAGDERGDRVPSGEQPGESGGAGRVNDRGEQHPELSHHGDGAGDVAVQSGQRGDGKADGKPGKKQGGHGDGEEKDGSRGRDSPKGHDRGNQQQADEEIEEDHVEPAHENGLAGEVDLGEHRLGAVEGGGRTRDGIDKDLPEEGSHHGEGGIGNAAGVDVDDALGVQEDEGHGGDQGRQKRPNVSEVGLAILGAEIPDEQPPSQLATGADVTANVLEQGDRMA